MPKSQVKLHVACAAVAQPLYYTYSLIPFFAGQRRGMNNIVV
jgi:hypothetical protein